MGGLKSANWKDFEKFLVYVGCTFLREKGDHRVWGRVGLKRPIVIPKLRSIPVFVIRNNLRLLGMAVTDYIEIVSRL